MKTLKVLIALTVFSASMVFAQFQNGARTTFKSSKVIEKLITLECDYGAGNADADTLFIPLPWESMADWESMVDTTAFPNVYTSNKEFLATGDMSICIIPQYTVAEESDSLFACIKPAVYSKALETWKIAANDSSCLVFNTQGRYAQSTSSILNWTNNTMYISQLSNEIWCAPGIALIFRQRAADAAVGKVNIYVELTYTR